MADLDRIGGLQLYTAKITKYGCYKWEYINSHGKNNERKYLIYKNFLPMTMLLQ